MTDNHKLSLEEYFKRYVSQRPLDGTRVEGEEDVSDPKEVDPQTEGSPPNADENIPQNEGQQKENEINQSIGKIRCTYHPIFVKNKKQVI